ncbi:acyltransferase [Paenibacillus polymyxa]|uniref:acyltransferase n=1 Tax=Paenibacillus polymyxa TaxID=1406 RepID=UPI0008CD3ED0|nr:acyltransferase [Paenibacillus polymyxa]SEI59102.1 Surface polysaccharide O-acyltransferase, integral membrane enzyme [Paenibacillus polymyxa]
MSQKERISEVALLRGLSFAAVVLQHSVAHYAVAQGARIQDGVVMTLLLLCAKFAVPVFVFITGMVLFYNYDGALKYGTFLRKRFMDIIVPYIIWSLLYELGNQLAQGGGLIHPLDFFQKLLNGKSSYHLWYIVMIIQCYVLFPVFRYAVRRLSALLPSTWRPTALAGFGVLYILLMFAVGPVYQVMDQLQLPVISSWFTIYADRNVIYFFFYFILGAAAGMNIKHWNAWVIKAQLVYWPLFIVITGYLLYEMIGQFQTPRGTILSFNYLSLLRPVMAVYCITSIFVAYRIATWIAHKGGRAARVLTAIGTLSYGAYLMHAFMLRATYYFDSALFADWSHVLRTLASFVLCMIFSIAGTWVLAHLPLGKWIVGLRIRTRPAGSPPAIQKQA